MYKSFVKRIIDIFGAVSGLVLLSPVLFMIFLYLYPTMNRKPFFFQWRTGINGNLFKLIKFKTMNDFKNINGDLRYDNERITVFGRFLRNTSLDEFPQLINVIKGEMSLVGPRPLLPEYLPLYTEIQRRRFLLRPGITGLAQISGRNAISWKQKFEYDVRYVDNLSFGLDIKILCKTVAYMFSGKDINSSEKQTMPKFNGYN